MSVDATDPFVAMLNAPDPSALFHRLRREDPIHFVPSLGFWYVTRHDDVKWLFADSTFTSRDRSAWEHFVPKQEGTMLRWFEKRSEVLQDPVAHARFRGLFNRALTPRSVRRMDAQIREVVERHAAPLRDRVGTVVDFSEEFTMPIPNAVISRVTGVPPGEDEVRFRAIAQGLIRGFFPLAPPEALEHAEICLREMSDWVRQMAKARRNDLGEDLISDLFRAQADDEMLDDDEIAMVITLLIGAGSETTHMGGMMMIEALLEHPEEMKRVRDDRSLIPRAVNEILRFGFGRSPAGLPRYAKQDFELRGRTIRKGQMLMLSIGAANRDPEVFPDPDRFDLERDVRESVVFGHGAHYCLGANLARQEIGAMLDAALDVVTPGSRLRDDLREYQRLGLFRRPLNLPVEIAG